MAITSTTFKKGDQRKRKSKGDLNKITKLTKEILESILADREDDINNALDELKNDPAKFIDAISKLLPYVIAKRTELTGAGGKDLMSPFMELMKQASKADGDTGSK